MGYVVCTNCDAMEVGKCTCGFFNAPVDVGASLSCLGCSSVRKENDQLRTENTKLKEQNKDLVRNGGALVLKKAEAKIKELLDSDALNAAYMSGKHDGRKEGEDGMNIYWASANVDQGCGCCFDNFEVVVANTEAEALGFLLTRFSDTSAEDWTLEPLDLTKAGVWGYD
ncbi:MAG: hypothetical protein JRC86_05955 [Deltaproteobacteria bacterium]|nr:hypothetical protein [Deltaproteobacteria bacterium]